jgi:hypothetical protein
MWRQVHKDSICGERVQCHTTLCGGLFNNDTIEIADIVRRTRTLSIPRKAQPPSGPMRQHRSAAPPSAMMPMAIPFPMMWMGQGRRPRAHWPMIWRTGPLSSPAPALPPALPMGPIVWYKISGRPAAGHDGLGRTTTYAKEPLSCYGAQKPGPFFRPIFFS